MIITIYILTQRFRLRNAIFAIYGSANPPSGLNGTRLAIIFLNKLVHRVLNVWTESLNMTRRDEPSRPHYILFTGLYHDDLLKKMAVSEPNT